MTVRIRKFRLSDREHIFSLVGRFSEFELPEWRSKEEIDQANHSFLDQSMKDPEAGSAIFIAEEGGAFAGFVHLQSQTDYFTGEKYGYISDLAVVKEFEGRGVGRILLETAEDWTRSNGYALLTLYVFAGNTRARQVYENMGSIRK
jgi:ribosomal protein S18 acetylase RimI-like enzyme